MVCRFRPCLAALFALAALGGIARAQNTPTIAEQASTALIEGALESLDLGYEKIPGGYSFTLGGKNVQLLGLAKGEHLLLKSRLTGKQPSLEALNRYNEQFAVTTRAVRYQKEGVMLEAGLDCRLGITQQGLRKFVASFGKDVQDFEQFIHSQKDMAGSGKVPMKVTPGSDDKEIEVSFPTGAKQSETAWKIVWDMQTGEEASKEGLRHRKSRSPLLFKIKKAYYRPGPNAAWLQVLEDAHPSEFYVPYFFQGGTRFFDLRDVGSYVRLSDQEGGPKSQVLGKQRLVMAELRDRGLAYKHGSLWRRAEELTLWANFQAGNYTYLVEMAFQDDGTIAFRHSPTGYNFFSHFDSAAHMHNCLWRIGVKLAPAGNGPANNEVSLVRLPSSRDEQRKLPAGKLDIRPILFESGHDWEAREFTKIRVSNPNVSVFPEDAKTRLPISYDLTPITQGMARHYRFADEGFSEHDFWVTRSDCPEKMYVYLHNHMKKHEQNPATLKGSDGVVLWHTSSALHIPRAEDGIYKGNSLNNGQALVGWTVVELRPRNLFMRTPLYQSK